MASSNRHLKTKRGPVIGKAKALQIKAPKRVANVFVSPLDPSVSEAILKHHLESTLNLDVTVDLCKLTTVHSSFHITCRFQIPRYSWLKICGLKGLMFDGGEHQNCQGTLRVTSLKLKIKNGYRDYRR